MAGRTSTSTWLMAAGLLLILSGLTLYTYPMYGEWRHSLSLDRPTDQALLPQLVRASPTAEVSPQPEARPTAEATPAPSATPEPTPTNAPSPTPSPTPTPVSYGAPVWLTIPSIDVDAKVVEVGLWKGEYWVPAYDVGHHGDSANPGEPGNSIYTGHVATIDAGRVFARLKQVKVGDAVYVYTKSHRTDWVVTDVKVYGNKDSFFLAQTAEPRLTLYTCHGTFDWAKRDYSHRIVVTAELVKVEPRR